jgi:hypothetical protein
VSALFEKPQSKEQLTKAIKMPSGGALYEYLKNLERASFVKNFSAIDPETLKPRSRTSRYELWDEWLHFYLTFMAPHLDAISSNTKRGLFGEVSAGIWPIYLGQAFERFVRKNFNALLDTLGISLGDVVAAGPVFRQGQRSGSAGKQLGLQIDLAILRRNKVLTLCECKYSSRVLGLSVAAEMQEKIRRLEISKKFSVEQVLVTNAESSKDLLKSKSFDRIVSLEDLYRQKD